MTDSDITFISELEKIVRDRLDHPSAHSYTSKLAAAGTKRIAQKVGEEGVELALAAISGNRQEITNEAADLVYHLLVLLADQGIRLRDVGQCLESRHAARQSNG